MPEITLTIPDIVHQQITGIFGEDAIDPFAITAIEELLFWIIAEQRPISMSELETQRIYLLYSRLFENMLPTAEDISKLFNLPMGRSRYIIQNLSYRKPEYMKKCRIYTIIEALAKGGESDDGLPIVLIPKECEEYLSSIATEMVLNHLIATTPKRIKLSERIRLELGINDREPLIEYLQAELNKLNE
jgi:hypothetical protein